MLDYRGTEHKLYGTKCAWLKNCLFTRHVLLLIADLTPWEAI